MKKIMRTLTGCLTVLCLTAGLIAQTAVPVKAATWTKTKDNTGLGTGTISDPTPGKNDPNYPWKGSYVYFGRNGSDPVKYRVLSKDTTDFSKKEEGKTPCIPCCWTVTPFLTSGLTEKILFRMTGVRARHGFG